MAADVLAGKTFSNSTGSALTGTMVNRGTLNWNPTTNTTQTVQPGYYSGGTLNSAGAYNMGKMDGATQSKVGTASTANVLAGKTFTNASTVGATGTMKDNGAWTNTPTAKGKVTIPAGYHNGSGYIDTTEIFNAGVNSASIKTDFISQTIYPGDNTISTNGKARFIAVDFTWGNGHAIWSDGTYGPNVSHYRGVESLTNVTENSFDLRVSSDLSSSPGSIWIIY